MGEGGQMMTADECTTNGKAIKFAFSRIRCGNGTSILCSQADWRKRDLVDFWRVQIETCAGLKKGVAT